MTVAARARAVHALDEGAVRVLHEPEGVEGLCVLDPHLLPVEMRFVDDVKAAEVVFAWRRVAVGGPGL